MTSTLVGIDEDLYLANQTLAELQDRVIVAYEAQDLTEGRQLEEALAIATQKRDSLMDTKSYIVNKERLQDCAGRLSTVLYLSQFGDTFSAENVSSIVAHANAKNELSGVTGVLYVLRGWFASYLEGSADAIDKLVRRLKVDPRHQRFRIIQRTTDVPNVIRRFPNNGLLLKRLETPQTVSQQNPEATMLYELSTHLKLESYVPILSAVTRGRLTASSYQPPTEDPAVVAARPVTLTRYLLLVQPLKQGPYYTLNSMTKSPVDHAALIESVFTKVRHVVEQTNNSLCQGAILSAGHAADAITCCFHTELPIEAVQRATMLFRALCDSTETEMYCPVMALHVAELEYSMDRGVRATGPALRLLRQHVDLAMQHHKGIVLSEAVFNALQDGENYTSFITTEFAPRRPVDVYLATTMQSFSWDAELEKRAKLAAALRQQNASRSSGSGHPAPGDASSHITPAARYRQSRKEAHQPTSEEANQKPIPGLSRAEDLRELFTSLGIVPNTDYIERSSLDAWLHTQENAGVPVYNVEVDRVLQQFADGPGSEFCSFDQFCMIVYQRLKG
ncbi:Hypothetical protein, putative [Bodo saltans]|uniref:BLUF domain-containing protein n=1 Tax=Bodo saltans TaxID=75058 RepID=A0A0S4J3M4_BODSA|nr:Hypothetical protein, putative [Bodo saltans]|eukprot:CUG78496.1 Hypothetical protein, putative [Bodo saltans]